MNSPENSRHPTAGLRHAISSLWQNYGLLQQMIKREVVGRYRGSMLGIVWSFFNPVFMLAVYTFVFSVVFQARCGGGMFLSPVFYPVTALPGAYRPLLHLNPLTFILVTLARLFWFHKTRKGFADVL